MAHTHIYIHTPSPAHTRAHIHAYIHTYAFSCQASTLFLGCCTYTLGEMWWACGQCLTFFVLTYTHTYIHMHTDTHFAIRRVCTYISLHAHIHICVCVCGRQPVLLLPHLAFRLGHIVIPDAFMPSCMRMCAFIGSLVVGHWSLLSLQLDGFVVIFSNLIKTRT